MGLPTADRLRTGLVNGSWFERVPGCQLRVRRGPGDPRAWVVPSASPGMRLWNEVRLARPGYERPVPGANAVTPTPSGFPDGAFPSRVTPTVTRPTLPAGENRAWVMVRIGPS